MPVQTTQHPMRRFLEIGLIPVRSIIDISIDQRVLKTSSGASYKITDGETIEQIAASFMTRKMEECNIKVGPDDDNEITVTICISHPDPEIVGRITLVLSDNIYDQIEEE